MLYSLSLTLLNFFFYYFLQVIRTLDPKQNQGAAPEIQALKNQLQERDRLFHSLEVVYCTIQ